MDQQKIDVAQTPCLVLLLDHWQRMLLAVIVVPKFCGDKHFLAFHDSFVNGTLNALTSFFLILVVVCSIKKPVACLDRLQICQRSGDGVRAL